MSWLLLSAEAGDWCGMAAGEMSLCNIFPLCNQWEEPSGAVFFRFPHPAYTSVLPPTLCISTTQARKALGPVFQKSESTTCVPGAKPLTEYVCSVPVLLLEEAFIGADGMP